MTYLNSSDAPGVVEADGDFFHRLKWLMFFRLLFTTLLLGSTIVLQLSEGISPLNRPLFILYGLIIGLFFLCFLYSVLLPHIRQVVLFAYLQIGVDTFAVTLIIFLTGGFSSLFSFLYLVVIIYASMLLFRKGSMIMAALCSIQYGVLVDLEFYGVLTPFGIEEVQAAYHSPWSYVLYKILIIMVACFAVAFLSGFLAEQARKSKKELQALANRVRRVERMAVVGEMAAGLAHEIKNPLASLRGSIQLLQEDVQAESHQARLMNIILREADRLSTLVSDFLLFARPPAGKDEVIDLTSVLTETVLLFGKDKSCENIHFHREIAPDIWIEMDPGHFRQVIWNLLLNAAEAIPASGRIDIRLYPEREQYAVVEIRDDGCGIPEEMLATVFDPFVTTKATGTGLGLSIVHRIMDSYNSQLDMESKPGAGTVVSLRLKRIYPDPLSLASDAA